MIHVQNMYSVKELSIVLISALYNLQRYPVRL